MNKFKKVAPAIMVAAAVGALASCGGGRKAADLTYVCPAVDNNVMSALVESFKTAYPEFADKTIELAANYGEGDVYGSHLHKDLDAAADVMLIADDNIRQAVKAEELTGWSAADKAAAVTSDGQDAVDACSINGTMYGLPYRSDNSPMPLYDTTVFTDTSKLATLEDMLETCKQAGKKLYLDMGNGWYNPFTIWAGGASISVENDPSTGLEALGLSVGHAEKSAQAVYDLYGRYTDTWVASSETAVIEDGFGDGSIGVAFMWNDLAVINQKNANVTATKWPTMNIEGTATQLDCWQSYKAVVVKAGIEGERLSLAQAFAKHLAGETAQQKRLTDLSYGPSNLNAKQSQAASQLPFIVAINQMAALGATHPQATGTTGSFWTPMGNFGSLITDQSNWGDYGTALRAVQGIANNDCWFLKA